MKIFLLKKNSLFKKSLAVVCAGLLGSSAYALSPLPFPVWTVNDGKLLDPNGNPFIFRGVTIDHTRAPEKTLQALKDIAALGANSAEIEFAIKPSGSETIPRLIASELREIIKACKDNKLVCVLEANDAAGYYEVEGGLSPVDVVSYWTWPDIREVLNGTQGYIVIGISNQPLASVFGTEQYIERMRWALSELRSQYPYFLVMLDGSNWGQDTDKAMHRLAIQNLQSTSVYQNVVYSVDMFRDYLNPEKVHDYISSFSAIGAPLVIGGFGPVPYYHPHRPIPIQTDAPQLPAAAVMQYAQQYGAGYFGWSWSGNENFALDVVSNWNPTALTSWGNLLFNDVNGIKATAKIASIYQGSSSSSSSSANRNPVAFIDGGVVQVRCGIVNAELTGARSTDADGDPLKYEWKVEGYSGTSTYAGVSLSYSMRPVTNYSFTLTVSDGKGGVGTASKILSHSYSDNCISSSSSSSRTSTSSSKPSSVSSVPSSVSSRSVVPSSVSSTSRSSSSIATTKASCSYVVNSQWNNGFTASIRIQNTSNAVINGWDVNWQYADSSKVTNLWNANFSGTNPYNAKNLNWNAPIQPGQTIEFGFQGSKPAGAASVPAVTGNICQ